MTWTVVIGLFLLAQGLVHVAIWVPPSAADAPFDTGHSWLFAGARRARPLLLTLAYLAAAAFAVSGIGLVLQQEWWRGAALIGAGASLLLLTLFFNPWLTFGVALNATAIIVLTQTDWLTAETLGW